MIIIIDEASAKLASFYYHGEIFKHSGSAQPICHLLPPTASG